MKKLLLILTVFISLKVSGQINAVNDTTRITASPTFSPQFVPNIFNSGGVNYRVTYMYNPSTSKYDAVVYSKYLRRFYIAKADSSSNYISPWQFNHGNNTIGGSWEFNNGVTISGNLTLASDLRYPNINIQPYNGGAYSNILVSPGTSFSGRVQAVPISTLPFKDSTYNAATYVPVTRQIINGYAITGGGTLGTDRTLAVDSTLQASKTYVQNYTSGFARLNGTGFVKASGTAISYDNTSYLPITGGTLTGTLSSGSTISSTSTVRAGNIALTTIPSLGASVGFTPMMGSASSSAGIVGVEVYTQDGTNNRRAGLVMNQTDNVWGLGYASSSGSSPFVIKSASTEWLRISTAGAVQLGQYTTAGVLTNDASGNVVSNTALPAGTTATTQTPGDNTTKIQTTAGTIAERTATATLTGKTLTTPKLTGYTVATLPSGTIGMIAYVTDALTPTFGNILVGGGSVVAKAFYNGTNWINE